MFDYLLRLSLDDLSGFFTRHGPALLGALLVLLRVTGSRHVWRMSCSARCSVRRSIPR